MHRAARHAFLFGACVIVHGSLALAQAPRQPVALTYVLGVGTESCPDQRWIRQAVAGRLGFEPFDAASEIRIEATISRARAGGLVGRITVNGGRTGKRELTSGTGDCLELASAMELAIAIAIDPQYLVAPPKAADPPKLAADPAEPTAPTNREFAPVVPAPPVPTTEATTPLRLQARVGSLGSYGIAPTAVPGFLVHVALRWANFSLGFEGRADLAGGLSAGTGRVYTSTLVGSVSPCFHLGRFGACGVASFGAIQVTGEIGQPRRESSPLILVGARVLADFPLSTVLSLQPFFEMQAVLTRTTVLSGDQAVWVTAPLSGAIGLTLAAYFL